MSQAAPNLRPASANQPPGPRWPRGHIGTVLDTGKLRPIMYRPSLIWSWDKLDVLPVIPVFNIASALGVPFIDKTIRVEELGKAIVAGLADEGVRGVQRFPEMESLAKGLELPA